MKIPQGRGLRFCLAQTAIDLGKTAATSANSRTQAIAGIAGGLAVYNSVDAVKDVARIMGVDPGTITDQN